MQFVKGPQLRNNHKLKSSFFQLAHETFGISFEEWDKKGFWDDTYCCYAFSKEDEIIANVSVSVSTLIIDGQAKKALQIGTVMTRPAYRGQGLARELMEKVLADSIDVDIIYLFANESVLHFYPKFGFAHRKQTRFVMETSSLQLEPVEVKRMDLQDAATLKLFYDTVTHRMPVSLTLGTLQNENIVMFHALHAYSDCIYYVSKLEVIVVAKELFDCIQLVDVISKHPVRIEKVLAALPIEKPLIEFGFTPEFLRVPVKQIEDNAKLFVLERNVLYPNGLQFPWTSKA